MTQTIQVKRGDEENLPSLLPGEPAITLNTKKFFVGGESENLEFLTAETTKEMGGLINIKYPPAPLVGAVVDGVTDDTNAIRAILAYAEANNSGILIPGVAVITGELEIKKTMTIQGMGSGAGYADKALTDYKQVSGFLVQGTGSKRVRTRVNYRASIADPQDAPLSVALNVQAENVVLKDFTIFLDFTRTNNSPTHYGYNWDIGLFIGCRVHVSIHNVHSVGYWRESCVYLDVTRSSYTPEFLDLSGIPYEEGTVRNGADGLTMTNVFTQGGKWGLKIQGAKPRTGETTYTTDYYDEIMGMAVVDRRGNFGASDVTATACSFYGTNHHSKYRRDDATGNYLTDPAGGSVSIDGLAGNASGVLQGMRFISCRFSTWEPFRIRLDRVNRPVFIGCHSEGGSGARTKNGTDLLYNDTDYYGPISTTSNTQNLVLLAFNSTLRPAFIGSSDYTNLSNAGSDINSLTDGLLVNGPITVAGINTTGSIVNTSGELDMRSAAAEHGVRFRRGSTTAFFTDVTNTTLYGNTLSSTDNTATLGGPSKRWSQVYAGAGTISTSDRNTKTEIGSIPDEVLNAWEEVSYFRFKFKDAVTQKGTQARFHIGLIAQEIEEAFIRHNLDAFEYGILCYDEWAETVDEEGNKVPGGTRYSIRSDECLMLEAALMRRKLEQLFNM